MSYKNNILKLHQQGKSYNQIAKILNCSKGTISYHVNSKVKEKSLKRQIINRQKQHPYVRKIEEFKSPISQNVNKPKTSTINHLFFLKIYEFCKTHKGKYMPVEPNFSIQDVINKFGENPKCYLTGQKIDIYKPRTYHFDHIIPKSRGGTNDLDNLGICTKKANQSKTDMTPDEYLNLCKMVLEHNGYKVDKK